MADLLKELNPNAFQLLIFPIRLIQDRARILIIAIILISIALVGIVAIYILPILLILPFYIKVVLLYIEGIGIIVFSYFLGSSS